MNRPDIEHTDDSAELAVEQANCAARSSLWDENKTLDEMDTSLYQVSKAVRKVKKRKEKALESFNTVESQVNALNLMLEQKQLEVSTINVRWIQH